MSKSVGGPGIVITAAFIGPGTVTICSIAGAKFGFQMVWALLLSLLITMIWQEMVIRISLSKNQSLGKVIKSEVKNPWLNKITVVLVVSAIIVGNSAYEAGNISGALLGLSNFPILVSKEIALFVLGGLSFLVLWNGKSRVLEVFLMFLVLLMSLAFVTSAVIALVNSSEVIFSKTSESILDFDISLIMAMIGTTVVPYNLFLHSSLVKQRWTLKDLKKARKDLYLSIAVGGTISLAIIITAAGVSNSDINNVANLTAGMEATFGPLGNYIVAIGLFAAGITSAITAPLAAAFVFIDFLDNKRQKNSIEYRLTWILVLGTGLTFSYFNYSPIHLIKFAQVANSLLLPLIAGLILWLCNQKRILSSNANTLFQNFISILALSLIVLLSISLILKML